LTVSQPLASWPAHWRLEPDGEPFVTGFGSRLAPVRHEGRPAMVKIAVHPEERDGAAVMAWWDGDGAAKVLEREGDALLMERAMGEGSLSTMARDGRDFAATLILCRAAARLHAPRRQPPPPTLKPLPLWFRALEAAAAREGGLFARSAAAARELLAAPRDVAVLHGDLATSSRAGRRGVEPGARAPPAMDPRLRRPLRRVDPGIGDARRRPRARPADRRDGGRAGVTPAPRVRGDERVVVQAVRPPIAWRIASIDWPATMPFQSSASP
jgi:hypothetical protein